LPRVHSRLRFSSLPRRLVTRLPQGFTASLALELEEFDVRVELVEPGYVPTTRFASDAGPRLQARARCAYLLRLLILFLAWSCFALIAFLIVCSCMDAR